MKTPEEARKTWCPWAQLSNLTAGASYNRINAPEIPPGQVIPAACCIADECSQWVWEPASSDMVRQSQEPGADLRGFCGRNVGMALKVFGLAGLKQQPVEDD